MLHLVARHRLDRRRRPAAGWGGDLGDCMRLTEDEYARLTANRQRRNGATQRLAAQAKRKRSKYGNKKTIQGDKVFASGHEARRYAELELLQRDGQIRNLQRQVPFDLIVNGQHICTYIADAVYDQCSEHGYFDERVVEDTKSPPTRKKPEYALKRKLMAACHGITIQEVM